MERLVNRRDVWGQYTLRDGEVGFITLPGRKQRALGSHMVTLNKLTHHFQAHSTADVISLHSISDHRTTKWFAIDIDLHDESIANADDQAAANLEAGLEWARRLREALFDPLFLDTNGVGGYHLWCLLDDEYPLADVYDYVSALRSDFASFGLARKPEAFPPKREVEDDSLPYPLRVPGRHRQPGGLLQAGRGEQHAGRERAELGLRHRAQSGPGAPGGSRSRGHRSPSTCTWAR